MIHPKPPIALAVEALDKAKSFAASYHLQYRDEEAGKLFEELTNAIFALAAAQPEPRPQEWRPIETCPFDGAERIFYAPKLLNVSKMSITVQTAHHGILALGATHWMLLPDGPKPTVTL